MNTTTYAFPDITITDTPWGRPDYTREVAPGIVRVDTPSHGGYWLSEQRQAEIPANIVPFTGDRAWWEEDCDWAVVALMWPDEFCADVQSPKERVLSHARAMLAGYHDDWLRLIDRVTARRED